MASIFKRKLRGEKSFSWRTVVRIKGYPTICETFQRKQEAEDWAQETERRIKLGRFKFDQRKKQYTITELIHRFSRDGALEHLRSAKDTVRHLAYWKQRLGDYALVHITSELLGKERQHLIDTPSQKETKRSAATINRYISSLSSLLSYAVKHLHWMNENPCVLA